MNAQHFLKVGDGCINFSVARQRHRQTIMRSHIAIAQLEREAAEVTPSRRYVEGLIRAARDRGLPATYVAELEARRPNS